MGISPNKEVRVRHGNFLIYLLFAIISSALLILLSSSSFTSLPPPFDTYIALAFKPTPPPALTNNTNTMSGQNIFPVCGMVVSGNVTLTQNLVCSGDGLIVANDGTTINLNGYSITGFGVDSKKIGIVLPRVDSVKVTGQGAIRNFQYGIFVSGANKAEISSIRLEDNQIGILSMNSANVRMSSNVIRSSTESGINFTETKKSNMNKNDITGNAIGISLDGLSLGNVINSNQVMNNSVVDLTNGNGLPIVINNNTFTENDCKTSKPDGLCFNKD